MHGCPGADRAQPRRADHGARYFRLHIDHEASDDAYPRRPHRCRPAALSGYEAAAQATLANPASQNCVAKGGKLAIEKNPKGGEYGVCVFADNLQCEEWAMLRGQCRTGGVKVTGYATPAARYCAITGGTYRITSASDTKDEKGTCTFRGANTCDALAYYEGSCACRLWRRSPSRRRSRALAASRSTRRSSPTARVSSTSSLSDGRKLTLPQAMSASGARYVRQSESVVFWNKGEYRLPRREGPDHLRRLYH